MRWMILLMYAFQITALSISDRDQTYLDICSKAASIPHYFQNFRSLWEFQHVVEISIETPCRFGEYLITNKPERVMNQLDVFRQLETIGNPIVREYPLLGKFSPTVLRYIIIADEVLSLFKLPENATVVEIGGGFGGQSFVLSKLHPIKNYYIFDIPEVNSLVRKVMQTLDVNHVTCLAPDDPFVSENIDLFISNYAFSECEKSTQLAYFEKVIKNADRGYLIYNHENANIFGLNSLSPFEFLDLLGKNGKKAKIYPEKIFSGAGNLLIVWDK